MANVASFPLVVAIAGDNVSTTCVVSLGYTPTTSAATAAYDSSYNSVLGNISSVVPGANQVTINFVAAFSGTIQVILAISNSTYSSAQIQPVTGTVVTTQATGTNLHTVVDNVISAFGTKTNNLQAPTATNIGTLPAIANAAAQSWTEGNQVAESVDLAGNLRVSVVPALPAGTNVIGHVINDASAAVIGHVITDTGSTTAVTGNVTVVQPTGTNLHAVLDTTSTTAVTQATGTNLHMVVDSGTVTTVSTVTAVTTVNASRTVGNAGATIDAAIGGVASTNAVWTMESPSTASAGAVSGTFINNTGASVNIKASAGNLYGFTLTNETAAVAYIEFFNIASAPVLGTTAVVFAVKIAANANLTIPPSAFGLLNFTTGIGFAVTTTENGVTTAAVTGMIFFK